MTCKLPSPMLLPCPPSFPSPSPSLSQSVTDFFEAKEVDKKKADAAMKAMMQAAAARKAEKAARCAVRCCADTRLGGVVAPCLRCWARV